MLRVRAADIAASARSLGAGARVYAPELHPFMRAVHPCLEASCRFLAAVCQCMLALHSLLPTVSTARVLAGLARLKEAACASGHGVGAA